MVIAGVSLWTAGGPSGNGAAAVVGMMVLLSVGQGFFGGGGPGKAMEKLQEMVETSCVVIRSGKEAEIPMEEIVPGDLVLLHAGAIIPADLRLLTTKDFFIRAIGVDGRGIDAGGKERGAVRPWRTRASSRQDERLFSGEQCHQRDGAGGGGEHSHLDVFRVDFQKLAGQRGGDEFRPGNLELHLADDPFHGGAGERDFCDQGSQDPRPAGRAGVQFVGRGGIDAGNAAHDRHGEPGQGALAMSRKKVIVKKLNSIQNFGAIDILCTDKTGTLTQDRIILEKHVDVTNRTSDDVLRYIMNGYYQTGLRNLLGTVRYFPERTWTWSKAARKVDIPFDFS